MANLKNQIEIGKYNKPKQNAWYWLLTNRGVIILFWLICPIGMFATQEQSLLGFIIPLFFSIAIPSICIVHDVKWYKELVVDNLIKTFKNSKFISKF